MADATPAASGSGGSAATSDSPSTVAAVSSADALKAEGNAHFKARRFKQAAASYSAAVEQNPTSAILFGAY
jgi:hypothetical protein